MILCVGLNPVYQKTITIENIRLNSVNRAHPNVLEGSAGKGINVARTIKTLGQEPLITGFLGGHTGDLIQTFLAKEHLPHDFVHVANATRMCITLLDPAQHTHTEIVEEGKPVSADEVERMYDLYKKRVAECELVTISGTAPQQVPDDMYQHFIQYAHQLDIPVLVDTQKQLLANSLQASPFLIKINQDELGLAFQYPVTSFHDIKDLIRLVHREGVEWVVISRGKEQTLVSHHGEMWKVTPPSIQAVNPIGSGDATLGGIATAIVQGQDMLDAIRLGTACGTANALTQSTGCIRLEDVSRLISEVTVERDT